MKSQRRLTLQQKMRRIAVMVEATLLLAVARLLILFVPFAKWRKTLGVISADQLTHEKSVAVDQPVQVRARAIGKQVAYAAHRAPFRAVCLPQAMTARWMLARRGIHTQLYIGAKRDDDSAGFAFHAWLMLGEECLTGQDERDAFNAFGSGKEIAGR